MDSKIPPKKSPTDQPNGWESPRHPNAIFLTRPFGKELVRMLKDVGKHIETAIPCKARKMISSMPVFAKPDARIKKARRTQPHRLIARLPTESAIEPASRRVQPLASLKGYQFMVINQTMGNNGV